MERASEFLLNIVLLSLSSPERPLPLVVLLSLPLFFPLPLISLPLHISFVCSASFKIDFARESRFFREHVFLGFEFTQGKKVAVFFFRRFLELWDELEKVH
jgi:hypothetical protein